METVSKMKPLKHHPLPVEAERIIREQNAPPRLVAHLTLVHDVAVWVVDSLMKKWPSLPINREEVLLGAALHDIGKIIHPEELTGPGKQHELAGEQLLLRLGVNAEIARFARTHGECAGGLPLEDLLVKSSDMVWKGTRIDEVESALIAKICSETGLEAYVVFGHLDRILTRIAEGAGSGWSGSGVLLGRLRSCKFYAHYFHVFVSEKRVSLGTYE